MTCADEVIGKGRYEVFQFGHDELKVAAARALLEQFLPNLFQRFDMNGWTG